MSGFRRMPRRARRGRPGDRDRLRRHRFRHRRHAVGRRGLRRVPGRVRSHRAPGAGPAARRRDRDPRAVAHGGGLAPGSWGRSGRAFDDAALASVLRLLDAHGRRPDALSRSRRVPVACSTPSPRCAGSATGSPTRDRPRSSWSVARTPASPGRVPGRPGGRFRAGRPRGPGPRRTRRLRGGRRTCRWSRPGSTTGWPRCWSVPRPSAARDRGATPSRSPAGCSRNLLLLESVRSGLEAEGPARAGALAGPPATTAASASARSPSPPRCADDDQPASRAARLRARRRSTNARCLFAAPHTAIEHQTPEPLREAS